ncbi:MAG: ROK family protein [Acidimicrobiia bacterium]|nr:ROK family protein [Acidimicrobiia bacterium]
MADHMFGGIEAGGTKFVCVVGDGPEEILERKRIDTTDPSTTLAACLEFFAGHEPIRALGIASFGPLELRRSHPDYGRVTTTPKPGWSGADLVGPFVERLGVPVAVDTDVNGAALAEVRWGAAMGLRNAVYVTVGTGVGGGAVIDGTPVAGLVHPEMGHVSISRLPGDDFDGVCPFHGDCFEGMASGPAIEARWGRPAEEVEDTQRLVEIEAATIAAGLRQIVYVLAPERIVLGGGVSKLAGLHDRVNIELVGQMSKYAVMAAHQSGFVVPPGLGDDAGVAGALALAAAAL